ncbi:ribonuclease D [Desulfofustis limnaeus]|uniref:Ribonuclease D n=2 Tax=Desulfofustis limnaeus TaxID=2740163 RepID=A0ABM7W723_9BACT|nr:ribonuclease D [Desulfofustis limnaeus]
MIADTQELSQLIDQARSVPYVALDTEFVWERTYYPQLGLIQLALAADQCYLIDPLAIDDLSSLGTLLADSNVVKILHDAPQDLAILSRATGSMPSAIFDTRVAAGFAGLSSTIGLAELITTLLGIELEKSQTRTDWLKRPLAPQQMAYALDDVRYLGAVRAALLDRITAGVIRNWLHEELDMVHQPTPLTGNDDQQRYRKVKGAVTLHGKEVAVLRELTAWREREARRLDRPRGHLLTDAQLIDLAKTACTNRDELKAAGLLSPKKLQRYGETILALIRAGRSVPPHQVPRIEAPTRLNKREKMRYERLLEEIRHRCEALAIDPQLVGSAAELRLVVRHADAPDNRLPAKFRQGWRRTFLEEYLVQPG